MLIQYLSLDWPHDNGWVAYNGLQLIAYFITVFIAAPLALLTGLGMSPALSARLTPISSALNIQVARSFALPGVGVVRAIHHCPRRAGGHHRSAGQPQPHHHRTRRQQLARFLAVRGLDGRCRHRLGGGHSAHPAPTSADPTRRRRPARPDRYPHSAEYDHLTEGGFADYTLHITGLVSHPVDLSLEQLRRLPGHEQITQHYCIHGWSGVAKWGGVSMQTIIDLVEPSPDAQWGVFYSLGEGADGDTYYDAHPIEHMHHHLTMLAYDMNGEPLSFGHGAPLRLRNEIELGFKMVKWLKGIEFVADFHDIGSGYGGYNQDHEFFGYRQAL